MPMTTDKVYECLKTVIDPELHVNIVDLGLIYKVELFPVSPKIKITMTLTSPACPLASTIHLMIREAVGVLPNIDPDEDVQIDLTFDPPWTQEMMSPELQAEFGVDDWY